MHVYRSRFLTRGEVWYDNEPTQTPVDWVFYHQRSRPVPGSRWKVYYTNLVELHKSPEELLQQMSKSTSYKIRRGRDKDKIVCECLKTVSPANLDEFGKAYEQFAASKHLAPLDRSLLEGLAQDKCLELSVARDPEGNPLVYHAYYRDHNRSCMLHSVSLYKLLSDSSARNVIGRANRYLFWWDILRHRDDGLKIFDFGGWYPGNTDEDLLAINRFKEEFGGKVVQEYNCEQILTLKGRIVLAMASLLNGVRSLAGKFGRQQKPQGASVETEVAADSGEDARPAPLPQPQGAK